MVCPAAVIPLPWEHTQNPLSSNPTSPCQVVVSQVEALLSSLLCSFPLYLYPFFLPFHPSSPFLSLKQRNTARKRERKRGKEREREVGRGQKSIFSTCWFSLQMFPVIRTRLGTKLGPRNSFQFLHKDGRDPGT